MRRWVAAAIAVLSAACGGDAVDEARPTSTTASVTTTSSPPSTTTTVTLPSTTTSTTLPPSTTTTAPVSTDLRAGDEGPAVLALQRRLVELGYWLGEPDGSFGPSTHHAVVALQKAAGLGRDGVVGPATAAALDAGVRPSASTTAGHVVEIDLERQLLLIVDDGVVTETFDTSTGRHAGSTPRGAFEVLRQIDGLRRSELGLLYRPKYFVGGVAIHGYTSVPPYPASHGCVRVTYPAMDHLWAAGLVPIGTAVVVR